MNPNTINNNRVICNNNINYNHNNINKIDPKEPIVLKARKQI